MQSKGGTAIGLFGAGIGFFILFPIVMMMKMWLPIIILGAFIFFGTDKGFMITKSTVRNQPIKKDDLGKWGMRGMSGGC